MKTIVVCVFFLVSICNGGVVEPKKYLKEVFANLLPHLLSTPGTVLRLKDFEGTIDTSLMNNKFNGTVKFHSGFVVRIGKLELNDQKFRDIWNDTDLLLANGMRFSDVMLSFDLDCESEEYQTPSVMLLTLSNLQFVIEISRSHQFKKVVSVSKYDSVGLFTVELYPSNAYTQIVERELNTSRGSTDLRDELISSLKLWVNDIQNPLELATDQTEFAELCYYCPSPPWA